MGFTNARYQEAHNGVGSGIVLDQNKAEIKSYDDYLDNTPTGRVLQLKSGVLQAMDATATPVVAGISLRNMGGEIENDAYLTKYGRVADVGVFHAISADLATGAVPTDGADVYFINVAGDDAGKVTQDSGATGAVLLPNASFYQDAGQNAWFVMLETIVNNG